ncbi:MAG: radical SAM protein [Bacteroidetes bacterium]|nr:radical SAM protein [Bacteroidota bacterium]
MAFLTEDLVFGPLKSRRLGNSLGVNLLPKFRKICTFNCVYCECGWNPEICDEKARFVTPQEYEQTLENALKELVGTPKEPNSITFSGNGEPTLHPDFPEIIDITIKLRDKYVPKAVISVLTNGTRIHDDRVFKALLKVDNNICKLDGGTLDVINKINLPNVKIDIEKYIQCLQRFEGQVIIQTLFLRGKHHNDNIDNTTEEEINLWLEHLKKIKPRKTMIYVIDRETPEKNLEKLSSEEMSKIADKVKALGLNVEYYS